MLYRARPYQEYATKRIINEKAVGLFLRPGLGKTASTLDAIRELVQDRFEVVRVLVIAPLRVSRTVWSDEVALWDQFRGLKVSKILGSEKQRLESLADKEADIFMINRENVVWLVEHFGVKWPFDMVVVDESSSFKNHTAKRFKALRKVRPLCKRVVILTGTPAPRSYLNLWSQVFLLDRGERLGKTITAYRDRFFEPDARNGAMVYTWKLKDGAEDAINALLSDLCVSMDSKDWLDLKEPIVVDMTLELPSDIWGKYKQLERDLILPYAKGDIVASTAAVLNNKLMQLANGAVYDENKKVIEIHNVKLDALEELIEEAQDQPVLVFYTYQHDFMRISKRFKARQLNTEQDIRDWNAGKIPLLLAHPASCGHGLNIQAGGHIIVWFGPTWDLELYEQANARLDRSGQMEQVIINRLLIKNSMDEICVKSLEDKGQTQEGFMSAIKAKIQEVMNNA